MNIDNTIEMVSGYRKCLEAAEEEVIKKHKQEIREMALSAWIEKYRHNLPPKKEKVFFDGKGREPTLVEMHCLDEDIFFLDPVIYLFSGIHFNSIKKVYPIKDEGILDEIFLSFLTKLTKLK